MTLVLVSYPFRLNPSEIDAARRDVARSTPSHELDLTRRFDDRLRGASREDYFVPDGHCNDAGYLLMAEIVAEDAVGRLPDPF